MQIQIKIHTVYTAPLMLYLVHPGPEGVIFDAPNRGNLLPINDSYALNKKDTLHPARVIYDIVVRHIQRAGLEFCDAACINYQLFQFLKYCV